MSSSVRLIIKKAVRPVFVMSFVLLSCLLLSVPALADDPTGSDRCAECHDDEAAAWQESPHAAGPVSITCEDCHGQYVEDHPDAGVMQLTVDSSVCQNCHQTTFLQWQNSKHAGANVQCIGCHLSHSQKFRLTDDNLCIACHRDEVGDYEESHHGQEGVRCADCHLETTHSDELALVSTSNAVPPRHDFTAVLSDNCLTCHQEELHHQKGGHTMVAAKAVPAQTCAGETGQGDLLPQSETADILSDRLNTLEAENRSLKFWLPVSLGIGLGAGGVLGVAAVLFCSYINCRRKEQ
ncbi:MAG: hypothetical protein D6784_17715 [Chloroflexi bacterium]|nr:MAG: hypothetical protein D6784_17715 [Chloroflexota bacterium]